MTVFFSEKKIYSDKFLNYLFVYLYSIFQSKRSTKEIGGILFFSNIIILIKTGATYPKVFSSLKKLFLNIYRKKLVLESHLKKVAEYVRNFIKKTLRGKCFAVNFAKIFRTSFFMEHLRVTSSEKNNIVHKIRFIEFLEIP